MKMGENKAYVKCKYCGKIVQNVGDLICDPCWEVTSRLESFLKSAKAREMVKELLNEMEDGLGSLVQL